MNNGDTIVVCLHVTVIITYGRFIIIFFRFARSPQQCIVIIIRANEFAFVIVVFLFVEAYMVNIN